MYYIALECRHGAVAAHVSDTGIATRYCSIVACLVFGAAARCAAPGVVQCPKTFKPEGGLRGMQLPCCKEKTANLCAVAGMITLVDMPVSQPVN